MPISTENKRKIAIIGGGICGLYLAWKLSQKGHEVTIFEKKNKIGNEVCSGLFSERILKFIPGCKKLIQNKIRFVVINFPQKTIRVAFSKSFLVMSHSALDRLIASLALKAGAKLSLNRNINSLPEKFDKTIGCDGAFSVVRKKLKLPEPSFRLGIQGFIKKESHLNYVEVWPCDSGFIWKIPRGKEIEYGIISDAKKAKIIFQDFLKKNNISPVRVKSKIIPQGFVIPSNSSVTLCGDAAGLTKPWSGGGVVWGLTAVEILLNNFQDFRVYKKKMARFFLPKIILSKIAVKFVYFLGYNMPWLLPKKAKIESDFLF